MKHWLLCFLCAVLLVSGSVFASDRLVDAPETPTLYVSVKGEITEMTAEEFALRVLLAEGINCPSAESKKAVAVSARSCGVYLSAFGCKHDDFDACDNGNCCFNLGDPVKANEEYLQECVLAVEETFGLCLCLENLPAMALFSLCNGSGSMDCPDFGYITAVKEDNTCQIHTNESVLDFEVLQEIAECDKSDLIENSVIVYGENKKCEFSVLGGTYIKAQELTDTLCLNSREFVLEFKEDGIHTKAFGVGSCFGLSLCGSEEKAKNGWNFEEIIKYYYPKLTLNKMYNN